MIFHISSEWAVSIYFDISLEFGQKLNSMDQEILAFELEGPKLVVLNITQVWLRRYLPDKQAEQG